MKCEFCNEKNATIHLTQVVNGNMKKLNICQDCAEKNGIDLNSPISITDILMGVGKKWSRNDTDNKRDEYDLSCNRCQMTRSDFKKQARLGCPECYKSFSAELTSIAQAMHHSKQHVGKIPFREGNQVRLTKKISCLQNKIEQAIKKENYEEAADLRDEISKLKKSKERLDD